MDPLLHPTILEVLQHQFTLKEYYNLLFVNLKKLKLLDLKSMGYNKLCVALLEDDILDYLIRMDLNNNELCSRKRNHYIQKFLNENNLNGNKLNNDINEAFENVEKKKINNNYTNAVFNINFENISDFDIISSRVHYWNNNTING